MIIYYKLRLFLKHLICKIGFGDRLIEYCHTCGIKQPLSWFSNDELYTNLMKDKNTVICPRCFNKKAFENGIILMWIPNQLKFEKDNIIRNIDFKNGGIS